MQSKVGGGKGDGRRGPNARKIRFVLLCKVHTSAYETFENGNMRGVLKTFTRALHQQSPESRRIIDVTFSRRFQIDDASHQLIDADDVKFTKSVMGPERWTEEMIGVNPDYRRFVQKQYELGNPLELGGEWKLLSSVELPSPPKYRNLDFLGAICVVKLRPDLPYGVMRDREYPMCDELRRRAFLESGVWLHPACAKLSFLDVLEGHDGAETRFYMITIPEGWSFVASLENPGFAIAGAQGLPYATLQPPTPTPTPPPPPAAPPQEGDALPGLEQELGGLDLGPPGGS